MSAIGTKRTSPSALHMSAFDPKRTSTSSLKVVHFEQTRRPDRLTLSVEPKEIPALIGSGNGELATKRCGGKYADAPTDTSHVYDAS
jgi:hypothetical protein